MKNEFFFSVQRNRFEVTNFVLESELKFQKCCARIGHWLLTTFHNKIKVL